jgi:hypothetical protein
MKTSNKVITWFAGMLIAMVITNTTFAQTFYSVNYQTFYNELAPYGAWIDYPGYGYVWSPNVDYDFRPYATNGYWVPTEYGNTWVSNYDWGWAPFHYGRWTYDNFYGWLWMPGSEWAPAWVVWRSGNGYYGWAPLGPNDNINITFNDFNYIPDNYWVFVPQQHICGNTISNYYVQPQNVTNVIYNTTIINNVHPTHSYFTGPSVHEMSRVTGHRVEVHAVNNHSRPDRTTVNDRSLNIYRPTVQNTHRDNNRPVHVTRYDDNQHREYNRSDAHNNVQEHVQPERSPNQYENNSAQHVQNNRGRFQNDDNTAGKLQRNEALINHQQTDNNDPRNRFQDNPDRLQNNNRFIVDENTKPVLYERKNNESTTEHNSWNQNTAQHQHVDIDRNVEPPREQVERNANFTESNRQIDFHKNESTNNQKNEITNGQRNENTNSQRQESSHVQSQQFNAHEMGRQRNSESQTAAQPQTNNNNENKIPSHLRRR